MKRYIPILVIIAGILVAVKPDILNRLIPENSTPTTVIVPEVPDIQPPSDPALLSIAKEYTKAIWASPKYVRGDALELVWFYLDFAVVALPNSDLLKTTTQVVEAHSRSGRALFNTTGMKGKYPQAAIAAERVLNQSMFGSPDTPPNGIPVVAITPEVAKKLVEGFQALAWGSLEAYKATTPET